MSDLTELMLTHPVATRDPVDTEAKLNAALVASFTKQNADISKLYATGCSDGMFRAVVARLVAEGNQQRGILHMEFIHATQGMEAPLA